MSKKLLLLIGLVVDQSKTTELISSCILCHIRQPQNQFAITAVVKYALMHPEGIIVRVFNRIIVELEKSKANFVCHLVDAISKKC